MARITILSKFFSRRGVAYAGFSQSAASRRTRLRSGRTLHFEPLEERRVLATFTVTNLNDATVSGPGSAPGTFRQAIYDANVASDADVIDFAPGLAGDLKLSIADDSAIGLSALLVTSPITIQGNAAGITIKRDITAPEMRFFRVALGGDLTLGAINLTGGITRGTNGASNQNGGSAFAGAIYNQGNLQISSSTLYSNSSTGGNAGSGGSSGVGQGGAVFNDGGSVSVRNSTLSGNSVSNGFGAIVARSFGGGIYSKNGSLTIDNSTITNGTAASGRDLYIIGIGAGQTATAQIHSSIIAQADVQILAFDLNASDDLGGQVVVTGSNNLIRSQNNFESIAVSSDDPLLGALSNNGGPTLTHSLSADSPAIGHGSNLLNLVNDQRGATYGRVVGAIDIGAFELQTVATPELPGDYNGNHAVDAADFVIWRKTKGADVPQYAGADGNGSSKIDDADYDVWRGNFGSPSSGSGATAASQSSFVTVEAQPIARSVHSNDLALVEALAQIARLCPTKSELHNHYRPLGEQASQPINQHDRDEALLAMAAVQFGQPRSTNGRISSNDEFEPTTVRHDTNDISLLLDVAIQISETTPE